MQALGLGSSRYAPHLTVAAVALLLATFATLSYRAVLAKSATYDEVLHAVANYAVARSADYRLDIEE